MACPRGYGGRHTGLYRDTEGKQPRAKNLRTKFQAPESARVRSPCLRGLTSGQRCAGLPDRPGRPRTGRDGPRTGRDSAWGAPGGAGGARDGPWESLRADRGEGPGYARQ